MTRSLITTKVRMIINFEFQMSQQKMFKTKPNYPIRFDKSNNN